MFPPVWPPSCSSRLIWIEYPSFPGLEGQFTIVNIARIEVFVAALFVVMLVFYFSSWAIKAVGTTAGKIIEEVRRQFRENPGIMKGTVRPDYARAVDITTRAAFVKWSNQVYW